MAEEDGAKAAALPLLPRRTLPPPPPGALAGEVAQGPRLRTST